jgi:hypothetical protein
MIQMINNPTKHNCFIGEPLTKDMVLPISKVLTSITPTSTYTPTFTITPTATPTPTRTKTQTITFSPTISPEHIIEYPPIIQPSPNPSLEQTPKPKPEPSPEPTKEPSTEPSTELPPPSFPMPGVNLRCNIQGAVEICASVSIASPKQYSNVTVYGRLTKNGWPESGKQMNTTWNYKNSTPNCIGNTNQNGVAECNRDISKATEGFQVTIDVLIDGYSVTTSFTPIK